MTQPNPSADRAPERVLPPAKVRGRNLTPKERARRVALGKEIGAKVAAAYKERMERG